MNFQHIVRIFICIFVAILTIGTMQDVVEARSYHFPKLEILAEVQKDGSMVVTEQRTTNFNGTFSGLYQWINKQSGEQIVDILVSEEGQEYSFHPGDEFGPSGTYIIQDRGDSTYIDWSFDATDEVRTFTLQYKVLNVVKVHDDIAELYYQFIGDQWEQRIDYVQVTLRLPDGASVEDIRAWGHGPLHGNVSIENHRQVIWEISGLPAKTYLTGRVTFPRELVPQGNRFTNEAALPNILEQEQKWADDANSQRLYAEMNWILTAMLFFGGLIYTIISAIRYSKSYTTDFQGDYYRELPAQYTPAEMAVLWRFKQITPADLTATILDLVRRGYVRIDEITNEAKGILRKKPTKTYQLTIIDSGSFTFDEVLTGKVQSLLNHENRLLVFLFHEIANKKPTLTFQQIESYAKRKRTVFASFWNDWSEALKKRGDELGFFDQHSGGKVLKHVMPGIVLFLIGFITLIWQVITLGPFIALTISAMITGILCMIGVAFHARRSPEGQEQFVRWKAFRRFLQHFSNMDKHDIPSLVIWEHYLVYAISLGVAKEVIKQLNIVFPSMEQGNHRFGYGWYYLNTNNGDFTDFTNSFENMTNSVTKSIQQSISTATSQTSSGSGGGGGFSGGGGGGFSGGGGGGAR
ncbi:hypothetical protein BHU72_14270 [Desulfuribacillus stibiiarsenatis]|uniref:DUF2207 domain-containing protein n=1 Tax=Desulfuribacillus stibiiarsenatis TaxID=1390249 RepID=A0A1E5L7X5_9FIRM|nr:DUF2207 domain-containing protein [Desulfuribacillus stibiiarsenatis]OEH86089.1 hypothetical protein BHU72_14270 [Desulfuribacillus stibiiarsenatis]